MMPRPKLRRGEPTRDPVTGHRVSPCEGLRPIATGKLVREAGLRRGFWIAVAEISMRRVARYGLGDMLELEEL